MVEMMYHHVSRMLMSYVNDVTCVFSAPIWSHVFPSNMEKLDIVFDYELSTGFKDPKLKRDSDCHFQVVNWKAHTKCN